MTYTSEQLQWYRSFERARKRAATSEAGVFDPAFRKAAKLSEEEFAFVIANHSRLKAQARGRQVSEAATQVDYRRVMARATREQMARLGTAARAFLVARHYLSCASLAKELVALESSCRMYGITPASAEKTAELLLREIQDSHRAALGLPLEWPAEDREQPRKCGDLVELEDEQRARRLENLAAATSVVFPFRQPEPCVQCASGYCCPIEEVREKLAEALAQVESLKNLVEALKGSSK